MSEKLDLEYLKSLCADEIPAMKPWRVLFLENVPALIEAVESRPNAFAREKESGWIPKDEVEKLKNEVETLRRHLDVTEHGLFIPPTKSDEILRCSAIYERCEEQAREIERLHEHLNFFGIEILEDNSSKFKPSTMDRWRKGQNNTEVLELKAEIEKLKSDGEGK